MYQKSFLFSIFIVSVLFVYCDEKGTEPSNKNINSILPLSVGNTWNYKIYNSSSDSVGQINWDITKKITIENVEYYLISQTGFLKNKIISKIENDGLFLSYYDSAKGLISPFFFKYPVNDNEKYQYQIPNTDSILNISVKKQNIKINNNDYNCYSYINNNDNPYFPFMYFVENVGLVRHKLVYQHSNGIDTTHYFIYDLLTKNLK